MFKLFVQQRNYSLVMFLSVLLFSENCLANPGKARPSRHCISVWGGGGGCARVCVLIINQ